MLRSALLFLWCSAAGLLSAQIPPPWGTSVDPKGLAQWRFDNDRLSVFLTPKAGAVADFNPTYGFDAPHRSLEVSGDFTAEVTALPITVGLNEAGLAGGGWIGSGLLVEVSPGTYARLVYGYGPDKPASATVVWDLVRDGHVVSASWPHDISASPENPLYLRIERRGDRLYGAIGQEREKLTPLYPQKLSRWPEKVHVGVLVLDLAPQSVATEFSDLRIVSKPGEPAPHPESPAPPRPPVATLAGPEVPGWGRFDDPEGVGNWSLDGPALELELSGAGIDLSRHVSIYNAPRVLREVDGNFTATVLVEPTMKPANPWRAGEGLWQTAGLMITVDGSQYVRYEISVQEDWGQKPHVHMEAGEPGGLRTATLRNFSWKPREPLWMRLTRTGGKLTASARQGDGEWQSIGETTLAGWPAHLRVGVEATNTTGNPYTARFRNLEVKSP